MSKFLEHIRRHSKSTLKTTGAVMIKRGAEMSRSALGVCDIHEGAHVVRDDTGPKRATAKVRTAFAASE